MSSNADYRPEIDGLRALAVLAILFDHADFAWASGGYLGVDVFFVISGYVITRILLAEHLRGDFSLRAFWRRRVRRIVPALSVLLAICLVVAWATLTPRQMDRFLPVFLGSALMVPNMVLWRDVGYFEPEALAQPLLHLWSLGVEEQFYLIYPLLLVWVWRRAPGKLVQFLYGLALASLCLAAVMAPLAPRAGFYLLPPRAWELLAGGLAAAIVWPLAQRLRMVLLPIGFAMILVPMLTYSEAGPSIVTLPPVLGTAICLMLAGPDQWIGRLLAWRPVVLVGKVSFGAYLWHWPLFVFPNVTLAEALPPTTRFALIVVALFLGWASWRFIETPFRRSERPILPRLGVGAGLASLASLAFVGGLASLGIEHGWRNHTWPGYQPQELAALNLARRPFERAETCHLLDHRFPSAPFIAAWNCPARSEDGLAGWPVAVFGDSHAADFSMVLRLSGRNPMQLTAWGCSAVPSRMRPECRVMADLLRVRAKAAGISAVVLVNRFEEGELSPEAFAEMEAWWLQTFDRLVIVAPLPSFAKLEERLIRWPADRVVGLVPDFSSADAFARVQKEITAALVLDPVPLFCADRPGCLVMGEGPLMLDESGHLSVEGARIYARELQATGVLDSLAAP